MYHCHVEATEHMQMGMLGNLYVTPLQDGTTMQLLAARHCNKFVYNDGDGSTGYDMAYPMQLTLDRPRLPRTAPGRSAAAVYDMMDTYPMINGRGYPDTINPGALPTPTDPETSESLNNDTQSQPVSALITAVKGEQILLRISNLSVTNYFTVSAGPPHEGQ